MEKELVDKIYEPINKTDVQVKHDYVDEYSLTVVLVNDKPVRELINELTDVALQNKLSINVENDKYVTTLTFVKHE